MLFAFSGYNINIVGIGFNIYIKHPFKIYGFFLNGKKYVGNVHSSFFMALFMAALLSVWAMTNRPFGLRIVYNFSAKAFLLGKFEDMLCIQMLSSKQSSFISIKSPDCKRTDGDGNFFAAFSSILSERSIPKSSDGSFSNINGNKTPVPHAISITLPFCGIPLISTTAFIRFGLYMLSLSQVSAFHQKNFLFPPNGCPWLNPPVFLIIIILLNNMGQLYQKLK